MEQCELCGQREGVREAAVYLDGEKKTVPVCAPCVYAVSYTHLDVYKRQGVQVVMDFSVFSEDPEYQCETLFPYVDYVFLSYDGKKDEHIKEWVKKIHSYGPKLVTATMGELGSICYDGTTLYEYGIVPTEVVNTVGAGDSYIAGFTYGILNGWSVPECMKKGAEVSSAVVARFEPY